MIESDDESLDQTETYQNTGTCKQSSPSFVKGMRSSSEQYDEEEYDKIEVG
jgi:hypothetical protein